MGISETETVVKRILPYLRRRGYDETSDFAFETGTTFDDRYTKGYVDILVTCGEPSPQFLVEAKRLSRTLTQKDEKQALAYGKAHKVPFVVLTNGKEMRCLNTETGQAIKWNGAARGLIPPKHQLPAVLAYLRKNKKAQEVPLTDATSLPFRPGLPLRQLNALFQRCHTTIRNIEKKEDRAFADFSKILFLKLLEEKADFDGVALPYSYRFHELAATPPAKADQVKSAIETMIATAQRTYGDVLADALTLQQPSTFLKIVKMLSEVSFNDSEADVKGAAFEYFVRATLKGKNLGQYFTPRPLVQLMVEMVGREKVVEALRSSTPVGVVDPACGTGGFLVYMLRDSIAQIDELREQNKLTAVTREKLVKAVKEDVFHGADANEGVASAAKMNMIVAGDGHTNINAEDTLKQGAEIWERQIDLILTNPPFGTSEADSLTEEDIASYPIPTTKGQLLFLQRMVEHTDDDGTICTVIDEGMLNTETASAVREYILQRTYLRAVVRLPAETFRPNKINVRSAVLLLEKRGKADPNLTDNYGVRFVDIESLGYDGTGTPTRGFDFAALRSDIAALMRTKPGVAAGTGWRSFSVDAKDIAADGSKRFDLKYWEPGPRERIESAVQAGAKRLSELAGAPLVRGTSPKAELYVDAADGYARVLKSGSSVDSYGNVAPAAPESDFVEKAEYDKISDTAKVLRGDVLLSSTGDGTLGKAAVYEADEPAVADGHVTLLRVDQAEVDPRYLADYLRTGFGREQIERLYTGSTGLIELTPQHVESIVVELPEPDEQKRLSNELREAESKFLETQRNAAGALDTARAVFANG